MNTLKKLQFYMGKRKVLMPIALTLSGKRSALAYAVHLHLAYRTLATIDWQRCLRNPYQRLCMVGGRHSRCRPCHLLCRADAFALSGVPGRNQYATYGYEKNHADAAWLLRPEYQRTDA